MSAPVTEGEIGDEKPMTYDGVAMTNRPPEASAIRLLPSDF
jgi:hypothetical protein